MMRRACDAPARLGSKIDDQERDDESADDRDEYDESAPWAWRSKGACVVSKAEPAEEGDVVEEADQSAKRDRAEAGHDTDNDGKQRQPKQPDSRRAINAHLILVNSFESKLVAEALLGRERPSLNKQGIKGNNQENQMKAQLPSLSLLDP